MEADWDEIARVVVPSDPGSLALPQQIPPVTTVIFDDAQELLWTGTDNVSPCSQRLPP